MKRKRVAIVAVCVVAIIVLAAIFFNTRPSDDRDYESAWKKDIIASNVPIVLLGNSSNSNEIIEVLTFATTNFTQTNTMDGLLSQITSNNTIVMIDAFWAESQNESELVSSMKTILDQGIPILTIGEMLDTVNKTGYAMSYATGPNVVIYGLKICENGITACYNGGGSIYNELDLKAALAGANNWALDWVWDASI